MKTKLISVTTSFACAGIEVDQRDIIIEAAPIFKYAIGKKAMWFKNYLKRRAILEEWYEHTRDCTVSKRT